MLRIHFTSKDLAATAIGHSKALPVSEAVMSLQVLRRNSGPLFTTWRRHVLERLPSRPSLLASLVPASGWVPDFLTPSGQASVEAGAIEAIRATPHRRVQDDLRRLVRHQRVPAAVGRLAAGDPETLDEVADALKGYHDVAVAPFAHRIQAILQADRSLRVNIMAREGIGAVLDSLHPRVRWREPVLEVPSLPGQGDLDFHLQGRGLLLCAHLFCGPHPRALLNDVDTPVLVYAPVWDPAAGGLTVETPHTRRDAAAPLAAVLGRTRARALQVLADPAGLTTTELAQSLSISAASASEHATLLRAAGLVTSHRHANSVRHTATPTGISLITAAGSGRTPH
ncbi:ArsR family transcriptional regulator [Streptomyces sp. NPDC127084]|uniref:ArsR family transcriptional regulator n=1 Tax=Streptomyces sp. NPDC127084 TaxID=3347133 RepID=UPI0036674EF0